MLTSKLGRSIVREQARVLHRSTRLGVGRRQWEYCRRRTFASTAFAPPHGLPASGGGAAEAAGAYNGGACTRPIAYWLLGTGALVAGMVTIGGITRLTRSGLSMTDWKIQGSLPPMTQAEWEAEFARYKTYPEYQQRKSMTLDEFKFIFWWEYGHRMMGRFLGLAYGLPLAYFAARGMIPRNLRGRLATLFALGGTQGLIGWWMVKSGLEMDPEQRREIRVSPYRLATHLGMAFTTYSLLIWTGLDLLQPPREQLTRLAATINPVTLFKIKSVRSLGVGTAALLGATILSGAFVAGNDAGHAYNTFPKMGDDWIPEEIYELKPRLADFFENTALVQLDHRILAMSTAAAVAAMYGMARGGAGGLVWAALPQNARTALNATAGMAGAQVALGISTLVLYVPIPLAAAHQAGSMVLLSCLAWSLQSLRFVKYAPRVLKAVKP